MHTYGFARRKHNDISSCSTASLCFWPKHELELMAISILSIEEIDFLTVKDHVANPPQCARGKEILVHIGSDFVRLADQICTLLAHFVLNSCQKCLRRY